MENISFFRKEMNSYGETSEVLEKILSENDSNNLISTIRGLLAKEKEYSDETYEKLGLLLKEYNSINAINEKKGLPKVSERSFFRRKMNTYFLTQEQLEKILTQNGNVNFVSSIRHILGGKDEIDSDLQRELESVLDRYNNLELDKSLNTSVENSNNLTLQKVGKGTKKIFESNPEQASKAFETLENGLRTPEEIKEGQTQGEE